MSAPTPADPGNESRQASRRPRWWIAVIAVVGVVVLGAGALFVIARRETSRLERVRAAVEKRKAEVVRRHDRPVLRGERVDGDALEAARDAVKGLAMSEAMITEYDAVTRAGGDYGPTITTYVRDHATELRALREAAQRGWVETGRVVEFTDLVPLTRPLAGFKLLLVDANGASPRACLEACADVVRLGQDWSLSGGLIGAVGGATSVSYVTRLALRCAAAASSDDVDHAVAEFRVLAKNTPAIGYGFEWEIPFVASGLLGTMPARPGPFDAFKYRDAVSALEALLADGTAWDKVTSLDYAASRALLDARNAKFKPSSEPFFESMEMSPRYLESDAATLAKLRALVVAIAGAGDGPDAARVKGLLGDPELADPFSGAPMAIERDAKGWSVVSLGPDGKRDDPRAPPQDLDDVVLVVPKR